MTEGYDPEIRNLDRRIGSLESDLEALSRKFGYTDDLDYELRDVRDDIRTAEGRIEELGSNLEELDDDLREHASDTDRALKRLAGQVQLLEGNLLASGKAHLADLDTLTDEQRKLARTVARGQQARSALLSPHVRLAYQQRVQQFETGVAQCREYRAAVIDAVGKLVGTMSSPVSKQVAEALTSTRAQEQQLRRRLDAQADQVEQARSALSADAKVRAENQRTITAGDRAEQKLTLVLRSRLADAISARAVLPAWFVTVLGSVPPAAGTRTWMDTATQVLLYRAVHNITDTVVALGDKPPGRTGIRAESYEQLAKDLRRW
ncbi:hypothetical protein ACF1FX_32365 [Streptomyces sp. NPDC014646]|uniref:hypothetical protein n=1 Tax=Streptomyces sp. NPDC014646 TaxID=3364877 RepID=UPI0036F4FECA